MTEKTSSFSVPFSPVGALIENRDVNCRWSRCLADSEIHLCYSVLVSVENSSSQSSIKRFAIDPQTSAEMERQCLLLFLRLLLSLLSRCCRTTALKMQELFHPTPVLQSRLHGRVGKRQSMPKLVQHCHLTI